MTGTYEFTKKIYYKNKDFAVGYVHPYKLKWCKYEPSNGYRDLRLWEIKYKATPLTVKDEYWPEGIPPDAEGKYVFGDVVAVKIPIEEHMLTRKAAVELADRKARSVNDQFEADAQKDGVYYDKENMKEEAERVKRDIDKFELGV